MFENVEDLDGVIWPWLRASRIDGGAILVLPISRIMHYRDTIPNLHHLDKASFQMARQYRLLALQTLYHCSLAAKLQFSPPPKAIIA